MLEQQACPFEAATQHVLCQISILRSLEPELLVETYNMLVCLCPFTMHPATIMLWPLMLAFAVCVGDLVVRTVNACIHVCVHLTTYPHVQLLLLTGLR